MEYAGFEGVIPKGEYGGGTVMLWDHGTYQPLGSNAKRELAEGKLHFALQGKKLSGEWTLVRLRKEDGKQWLLLKSGADARPISKRQDDISVVSQRSMTEIGRTANGEKKSRRAGASQPRFVEPMMAKLVESPPAGDWNYELKFDGFRAIAVKLNGKVQLFSRNKKDLGERFPEIRDALSSLPAEDFVCDGEIVALDARGHSSFQLLQGNARDDERPELAYYLFDLLHFNGEDLTARPLGERRGLLEKKLLRGAGERLRHSGNLGTAAQPLLKAVRARGLEGLIGKRVASVYEPGRRSGAWIKLKCLNEQEFVIGGYTAPQGSRDYLGALLVGYYQGKKLHFAGKVGTGFDTKTLRLLHRKLSTQRWPRCPFPDLPEKSTGRWAQNITAREMAACTWIKPTLVCQIKFTEWTRDGKLRHPVFLGLRDDKAARLVRREKLG